MLRKGLRRRARMCFARPAAIDVYKRQAQVDAALATEAQAQAGTAVRKLDVAYSAADSYLQVWATSAVVQATRASVERAKTLATVAESYQRADLRPGADASRSRAELALAQAQQALSLIHI